MKPRIKIASTKTPDGGRMALYRHDGHFSIEVNGADLMHSRRHESERGLACLGCAHLVDHPAPAILIGGLGMGYTLRQALDMLSPRARVVVAELMPAVADWNREHFAELNGRVLEDNRVDLQSVDIVKLIASCRNRFDAILLDVDNGPEAMSAAGNRYLYGMAGIKACRKALVANGCLAVWSAKPSQPYEQRLLRCDLHVRRFRVPAYRGQRSNSHIVWVAAPNKANLPPGGDVPRVVPQTKPKPRWRRQTSNR